MARQPAGKSTGQGSHREAGEGPGAAGSSLLCSQPESLLTRRSVCVAGQRAGGGATVSAQEQTNVGAAARAHHVTCVCAIACAPTYVLPQRGPSAHKRRSSRLLSAGQR